MSRVEGGGQERDIGREGRERERRREKEREGENES